MSGDIVLGIRLKGDASGLVGEVKIGRDELGKMAAAGDRVGKSFKGATEQAGGLSGAIAKVGHYASSYLVASQVLTFAAAIKDAALEGNRLQQTYAFAFGGMAEGARNLDYVRGTAAGLGLDLNSAARAYGKLSAAAYGTALEGERTRTIFEAVSKATVVMGLSAQEADGALLAIAQMMSKGTVQAEELRGQLGERIPGAFQIAARAMGTTTAGLGKMLEAGQVVASDFLPKFAAELERTLGGAAVRAADSLQATINRLDGSWQKFKQSLGGTGGGSGGGSLASVAGWLSRTLEDAAGQMDRVARNGHGLLARLFVGLGAVELNILSSLFDGKLTTNPGTGAGLVRDNTWMTRQLAEIERLKAEFAAARKGGNPYVISNVGKQLTVAEERYAEAFAARNAAGIRLPDLQAAAERHSAEMGDAFAALYGQWSADLAAHSPVQAAKQAIADYKKKYAMLQTTNPEAWRTGLAPLQNKLFEATVAAGAKDFAVSAAGLDARGAQLNAWYDEYRDTVRRALDESRTDYEGYWALVAAGERHLAEEQLKIAEARRAAAEKRGDKPGAIKLQGDVDALRARLGTGVAAEAERGLANDLTGAANAGRNALQDAANADAKALATAAAWRRENLSLVDQELAAAREKAAADLRERQAVLARNEALRHAPELLREYSRAAAEQSATTLAAIEAEIRARDAANRDWSTGATSALAEYRREISDVASMSKRLFSTAAHGIEDVFVKMASGIKVTARDLVTTLLADGARLYYRQNYAPGVANMIGAGVDWLKGVLGGAPAPGQAFGQAGEAGDLLGFAGGGDHAGGWRIVGERGPELEATGPARIFSADQTRGILAGGGGGNLTVNLIEDSSRAGQVRQRDDGGERMLDLFVARIKAELSRDLAGGAGIWPGVEARYGLNRAAGAMR